MSDAALARSVPEPEATLAARLARRRIPLAIAIGLLGGSLYALLLERSLGVMPAAFGADIYDQMWLAILDGRLDLPARVLRGEGHYAPDGTAYSYHGVAPLLTRALFDPFVTIGTTSLAPVSIWVWATLGTAFYHAALLRMSGHWDVPEPTSTILGITLWLVGPGVILTSNHPFYHEPVALAYALTGAFVLISAHAASRGRMTALALIGLGALAAIALHARPNVAVGLYAGTVLAIAAALWRAWLRVSPGAVLGLAMLGAGAAGYLALNDARFGSATAVHGSFDESEIRYGIAFWEMESANNARQLGFIEHGRFNAGRILPNGAMYLFAPPQFIVTATSDHAAALHRSYTEPRVGFIRLEAPRIGMLFYLTPWIVLAGIGLWGVRRHGAAFTGLLLALGGSALLTLSYATITLRYHVDLWPLVFVLALLALPSLARTRTLPYGIAFTGFFALGVMANTALYYPHLLRVYPETGFAEWSEAECQARASEIGLPAARIGYVCRDAMVEPTGG
ncbi:MAG: hypothetical protein AAF646_09580 [Pseudomonadota bacterium]